jgi:hypothetical protein
MGIPTSYLQGMGATYNIFLPMYITCPDSETYSAPCLLGVLVKRPIEEAAMTYTCHRQQYKLVSRHIEPRQDPSIFHPSHRL